MLVVIAIIAILAAILLPVLNKARMKGQQVYCLSNHKQFAAGTALYIGDNRGYVMDRYGNQADNWSSASWMRLLINGYGISKKNFVCPSISLNNVPAGYDPGIAWEGTSNTEFGISIYSFNSMICAKTSWSSTGGPGGLITRCDMPTVTILTLGYYCPGMVDGVSGIRNTVSFIGAQPSNWRDHGRQGLNFSLLDGHAESIRYPSNPKKLRVVPIRKWFSDSTAWLYGYI